MKKVSTNRVQEGYMGLGSDYTKYADHGFWALSFLCRVYFEVLICVVTGWMCSIMCSHEVAYTRAPFKLHKLHKRHTKTCLACACARLGAGIKGLRNFLFDRIHPPLSTVNKPLPLQISPSSFLFSSCIPPPPILRFDCKPLIPP